MIDEYALAHFYLVPVEEIRAYPEPWLKYLQEDMEWQQRNLCKKNVRSIREGCTQPELEVMEEMR